MPFVERAGTRLHYAVHGEAGGGDVLLLHPLATDETLYERLGLVAALVATGRRVVAPTAVGHGRSAAPLDRSRYALEHRVADVLAVLDDVGAQQVACAGYSMGGWTAWGLLAAAPDRVSAVSIGGWDPIGGVAGLPRALVRPTFPPALALMRRAARTRDMLRGVSTAALTHAFLTLYDPVVQPAPEVTAALPLQLWVGRRDAYRTGLRSTAGVLGATLLEVPGTHGSALYGPDVTAAVAAFLTGAAGHGDAS